MRDEAEKRIGHLYPKVKLPKEYGGSEATVIAWLWARTVKCPNPACGARMPLVRSFWLSTKKGKKAWVEPVLDRQAKTVQFKVKTGEGMPQEGTVSRQGARCIACNTPVPFDHVRVEGKAGQMKAQLMAIVAEGRRGRIYLPPNEEHEAIAAKATPRDVPDTDLPEQALGFRVQLYGMTKHRDLFTPRQLVALTTFSDLVGEARERVLADARQVGMPDDGKGLNDGDTGRMAYADAVSVYLGCALSRLASYNNTICYWNEKGGSIGQIFARQAIPMSWDFIESNPLEKMSGNWLGGIEWVSDVLNALGVGKGCSAVQLDAAQALPRVKRTPLVATDPPYYDNVGYADLSDFFYVWLRRPLKKVYPDLFNTLLVPKAQELVATPYRFGGDKEKARKFFEGGLSKAFAVLVYRVTELL
jgi:putative DNA methylase